MTVTVIRERVAQGAALLDREWGSEWIDTLDLSRLSIVDFENCVLGQLYGGYCTGATALGLSLDRTRELGFTSSQHHQFSQECGDLTAEWKMFINGRRANG